MSTEEIDAVKDALSQAGFTGLHVHVGNGVATLNGPLPFDHEAVSILTEAWPERELGAVTAS